MAKIRTDALSILPKKARMSGKRFYFTKSLLANRTMLCNACVIVCDLNILITICFIFSKKEHCVSCVRRVRVWRDYTKAVQQERREEMLRRNYLWQWHTTVNCNIISDVGSFFLGFHNLLADLICCTPASIRYFGLRAVNVRGMCVLFFHDSGAMQTANRSKHDR